MNEWMQKQAEALSLLVEQGVSFDEATQMVKVASEKLEKEAGLNMTGVVKNIPAMAKSYAGKAAAGFKAASPKAKLGMAAAGGAVVGAVGARAMQEKKAEALSMLVEQGMEFEKAAEAVEAKAAEFEKAAATSKIDKKEVGKRAGGIIMGSISGQTIANKLSGMATKNPYARIAASTIGGLAGAEIGDRLVRKKK